MPRTIDLPFVGTPTNLTEFIVTKRETSQGTQNTGRMAWNNITFWLADAIGLDQPLSRASSPSFRNISILSTGSFFDVVVNNDLTLGVDPANRPDNASVFITNDSQLRRNPASIILRGHKTNMAGFNPEMPFIEGQFSRGTAFQPIAVKSGDIFLGINVKGYDGVNYTSTETGSLRFYATSDFIRLGNLTSNAGTGFQISTYPENVIVEPQSNFTHIHQSWSTSPENITISELYIGDGSKGQAVVITNANGIQQNGHGASNVNFVNSQLKLFGVTKEATIGTMDNNSLDDTVRITLVSGRRSGISGRRDPLLRNDTIGRIDFRGQGTINSAGQGYNSGQILYKAIDNYTTNTHGSSVIITSINSGTNLETERFNLNNITHNHRSDNHFFYSSDGTLLASITTSSFNFYTTASFVAGLPSTPILAGRVTLTTSTNLASNTTGTIQFEAYKSWMLSRVTVNYPVWLRVYSDATSRSNDADRAFGALGTGVSGLIYELFTTSFASNRIIAPGILGFNADNVATGTVYLSVMNRDIVSRNMVIGLTLLRLEN